VTPCRWQPRHLLWLWLPFALLALIGPDAAAAQPVLLVQDDLADMGPGEVTGRDWTTTPHADLQRLFCATRPDATARLALASQRLTRRQRDACVAGKDGKLIELLIGRRALIAMTSGTSFGLTPDILYHALVRDIPGPGGKPVANRAMRWRELDASLPDAPIRVLLPPTGSIENRIVSEIILYEGCAAKAAVPLPADPIKRLAVCTTLRSDSTVTRGTDKQTVSAWLHKQGAAAVALIGVAVLLAEPDLQTALPLDGVTPSFATIADGRYRAVLPVYLLTVISPATVRTVAGIAGPLLTEATIGPLGKLPRRGLAPLAAADRVNLRLKLGREFEDATE
jgi:phosphate transport system substrate-binding protein